MLRLARFLLIAIGMFSAPVAAQELPAVPTTVTDDAPAYAQAFAVPEDVATHRLAALDALAEPIATLRRTYRDRLAGIAIVHAPTFGIRVLLTGTEPVADTVVVTGGMSVPVTFATGATATLEQLRTALANSQADLRAALVSPPGVGIDQRTGELVIVVAKADMLAEGAAPLAARLHAIAGVPLRLRSIDVPGIDLAAPTVGEGGMRLVGTDPGDGKRYVCTAGFVVTDGIRTALATAAHCPDEVNVVDADRHERPLSFVGQWGWGYQDVQINASAVPLPPLFFADTARTVSRPVERARGVADTVPGDFVCHRGERTRYSCAVVELTDFAPAGDLCGGACTPSWITVAGPHCGGGDSGAPVFAGTTAYGIVKGGSYRGDGSCAFYFYMSTDYLPAGWRLLFARPDAQAPPDAVTAADTRSSPDPMRGPAGTAPPPSPPASRSPPS